MDTGKQSGATLVLLRHGESTWNLENLFTGWHDVPLSERGVKEATEAGRLMREAGLRPAVVHESLLVRAIRSSELGASGQQRAIAMIDLQTAQLHAAFGFLLVLGLALAAATE